jgi:hypothetical protein
MAAGLRCYVLSARKAGQASRGHKRVASHDLFRSYSLDAHSRLRFTPFFTSGIL